MDLVEARRVLGAARYLHASRALLRSDQAGHYSEPANVAIVNVWKLEQYSRLLK
jgi:hypothetical protein